ncbi:MAG: polyprenyl synthetase family protein [Propionibacteriaceae bacterium]|nr:polyprenyl synthetase family protein [Propionibacteriaceae bacterium]
MRTGTALGATTSTGPAGTMPALTDSLAAVQEQLRENLTALDALWRSLGGQRRDPVLELDLPAWLRSLMEAGGKRLRSRLCHWGFVAAGGTITDPGFLVMTSAGAALEMLHEFALIHDDVMDESDLRRGRPAAHRQAAAWHAAAHGRGSEPGFGRNLAILLGDLALVQSQRLTEQWPPELRATWHELCVELVLGQRADLTGAAAGCRERVRAEQISRLKSGAYTVTRPLQLGAMAAGAPGSVREILAVYGFHTGAAFALRDDILGIWGDPAVTGKPAGDDLSQAKPTVVLSIAAERLVGAAAEALARIGTDRAQPTDVALLQTALTEAGIRAEAEEMIAAHVVCAHAVLESPEITAEATVGLREVAEAVAWRSA